MCLRIERVDGVDWIDGASRQYPLDTRLHDNDVSRSQTVNESDLPLTDSTSTFLNEPGS